MTIEERLRQVEGMHLLKDHNHLLFMQPGSLYNSALYGYMQNASIL